MSVFGDDYSRYYELLYRDKDYEGEEWKVDVETCKWDDDVLGENLTLKEVKEAYAHHHKKHNMLDWFTSITFEKLKEETKEEESKE